MRIRLPPAVTDALIPAFEREYKELLENWTQLERKAQLTAAADGAILSVCIANLMSGRQGLPLFATLLILVATMAVGLSALLALGALRVQSTVVPAPGDDLRRRARALKTRYPSIKNSVLIANQKHHVLRSWEHACEDLHKANELKANWLDHAHTSLQVAGGAIVLCFLVFGFTV